MALLGPAGGKRARNSLGGLARIRSIRGILQAAGWPRHKPRRKSKEFQDSVIVFDAAAAAYPLIAPEVRRQVAAAVVGTQWLARDVHTVVMYGTLFCLTQPDGSTIWPMAATQNVSEALDAIGSLPGGIMVRTAERWLWLPPGPVGYVLAMQADGLPAWQDSATL